MKTAWTFLFISVFISSAGAQCGGTGVQFNSQTNLNNFLDANPDCESFDGFVFISGNVTDLSGLSAITSIGGYLNIIGSELTSLAGLEGLTSVGGNVNISDNSNLTSLAGLSGLTSLDGNLYIDDNAALPNLSGLDNLTHVGGWFNMAQNGFTSMSGLENLLTVGTELQITNNENLVSLSGLNNLQSVGEVFSISSNESLVELMTATNLVSIGGNLNLVQNPNLISIAGFGALTSIGEDCRIDDNFALANLTGLEQLSSVGGDLSLEGLTALTSLSALSNLTSMNGTLEVTSCDALTSLDGLQNIDPAGILDVQISDSPNLSDCAVASLCEVLDAELVSVYITENAAGCNDNGEVLAFCSLSVNDPAPTLIQVSPNPVTDQLMLSGVSGPCEILLHDAWGRLVLRETILQPTLDVSALPSGLYFLQVSAADRTTCLKVIRD